MNVSSKLQHLYGDKNFDNGEGEKILYSSSNFTNVKWWQSEEQDNGKMNENEHDGNPSGVKDPYCLLESFQKEGAGKRNTDLAVLNGGSAISAYHTLQCKTITTDARVAIENSLLQYCELDTLAMVMIVQAWQGFLEEDE
eukprot:15324837-Ditylum_brightwellii.AAC.1